MDVNSPGDFQFRLYPEAAGVTVQIATPWSARARDFFAALGLFALLTTVLALGLSAARNRIPTSLGGALVVCTVLGIACAAGGVLLYRLWYLSIGHPCSSIRIRAGKVDFTMEGRGEFRIYLRARPQDPPQERRRLRIDAAQVDAIWLDEQGFMRWDLDDGRQLVICRPFLPEHVQALRPYLGL